jgi:hypothetical protein
MPVTKNLTCHRLSQPAMAIFFLLFLCSEQPIARYLQTNIIQKHGYSSSFEINNQVSS